MKNLKSSLCVLALILLAAGSAHATITVLDYWRMGENDTNAVSGGFCTNTIDAVGGKTLTNTLAGGLYPAYTNGVSLASSAETGSSLALSLTNGQYGTALLATSAADNFGIECWVKPGTTAAGGQILAYNGLRGNGWGLYQSGTSFQVLYGGELTFGSVTATAGVWTHLALVRNNGVAILYANGVPASTNSSNSPLPPSGGFTVGGDAQYPEYFSGTIDEVRVFTFAAGAFSTNDLLLNATNLVVTSTNDVGSGSLRNALAYAPSGAVITFATNLSGQTILLTSGQIILNNSVTIDASALPNGIQINGNANSRIFSVSGVSLMLNSLIITNGYGNFGSAILNEGNLTVDNCTFVGNHNPGSGDGGAIANEGATLAVTNSTFTDNHLDSGASDGGGAIVIEGGTVTVNNSTITGNTSLAGGGGIQNFGILNMTNTIDTGNTPEDYVTGDHCLLNVNPLLAPLGNYGGPTPTMPPLAGSPAIDAGTATTLTTDQRGYPRLSGAQVDIGAVEVDTNSIVTINTDNGVAGSLRYVITHTQPGDLISFAQNLSGQTILLANGQLTLNQNVTIDASALANGIQLNGNANSRIFYVSGATVTLNALTITNGFDNGVNGGGILNNGTLTVNNSTLVGNIATGYGGGIESAGMLTLNQTTITGNSSGAYVAGGGIDAGGEPVVINQSTITGNTDANSGAGGILNYRGAITLNNSIVAGNTGGDVGDGFYSSLTLMGTNFISGNPLLAPLGNYGGPTPTMPPLAGSPAIDKGAVTTLTTDQRGYPRPSGAGVDIGAVEVQVASGPFVLNGIHGIARPVQLVNGQAQIAFTNLLGGSFTVFATTNLALPFNTWSNLGLASEIPVGSGQFQFTDPHTTNYSKRFYRVSSP